MESFDEWVKTSTQPCIQRWADQLMKLGASWESFHRDSTEIVNDLVSCNIPLLAARDIVKVVSEALSRSQTPLAIFWDVENVPIPRMSAGRDVVTRIKTILTPHGQLVQFRAYSNIGLGLIPQHKRSDLQLSGCHLVDCPAIGRKEVADKMIIVDAMEFAYTHMEGATLCFITGDVDFAYLLSKLKDQSQWRTIVISKGTVQTMLHESCDITMRWETDILELEDITYSDESYSSNDDCGDETAASRELGTNDEDWAEDAELLRSLVRHAPLMDGQRHVLKSYVGNMLRQTDPDRFANREDIKYFLAKAINKGVVVEMGNGPYKTLRLPKSSSEESETGSAEDWVDDTQLLQSIVRDASLMAGQDNVLKATVGGMLRERNDGRFANREDIKIFLAKAIETGVVVEMGHGPTKTLRLPTDSEVADLDEEWSDDIDLLRSIIHHASHREGYQQALKSLVGIKLKQMKPSRFSDREAIQSFLAKTIESGVVAEIPNRGGQKLLRLSAASEAFETKLPFDELTAAEQWKKYSEILQPIIRCAPIKEGQYHALKSYVGIQLRQNYHTLVANREVLKLFLSRAIELRVILEMGEGPNKTVRLPTQNEESEAISALEALADAEKWTDDAELLQSIIRDELLKEGQHHAKKSLVGLKLRQKNPDRVPDRDALQLFFTNAIETGVIIEMGEGGEKTLQLPTDSEEGDASAGHPTISLSEKSPVSANDLSQKTLDISENLPFMLFVPWLFCPQGTKFPPKTFVQSSGKWAILMFKKLTDAQRVVSVAPWLRAGSLVDWRRIEQRRQSNSNATGDEILCDECNEQCLPTDVFRGDSDEIYCLSCFRASSSWSDWEKENAIELVVEMLEMMAENDDVFVNDSSLKKQLIYRWPDECENTAYASLWIEEAITAGSVIKIQKPQKKIVCLPKCHKWLSDPGLEAEDDFSREEWHVIDLLRNNGGWMMRTDVISSLKSHFVSMSTPTIRFKMFLNAKVKGLFYVAKGAYCHTVGLTGKEAFGGLSIASRQLQSRYQSSSSVAAISRVEQSTPIVDPSTRLDDNSSFVDASTNIYESNLSLF